MMWGKGFGRQGIMTVKKLHAILGDLIDEGDPGLFVHGVDRMYVGERSGEGVTVDVEIDFADEVATDHRKKPKPPEVDEVAALRERVAKLEMDADEQKSKGQPC